MRQIAIWLIMLFVLSVMPTKDIPIRTRNLDKLLHAVLYAITCLLFYKVLLARYTKWKSLAIAFVSSSLYGVLMEFAQQYIAKGRSMDTRDMAANTVGALIIVLYIIATHKQKAAPTK